MVIADVRCGWEAEGHLLPHIECAKRPHYGVYAAGSLIHTHSCVCVNVCVCVILFVCVSAHSSGMLWRWVTTRLLVELCFLRVKSVFHELRTTDVQYTPFLSIYSSFFRSQSKF